MTSQLCERKQELSFGNSIAFWDRTTSQVVRISGQFGQEEVQEEAEKEAGGWGWVVLAASVIDIVVHRINGIELQKTAQWPGNRWFDLVSTVTPTPSKWNDFLLHCCVLCVSHNWLVIVNLWCDQMMLHLSERVTLGVSDLWHRGAVGQLLSPVSSISSSLKTSCSRAIVQLDSGT